MVAIRSTRRQQQSAKPLPANFKLEALAGDGPALDSTLHAAGSHRAAASVAMRTDAGGEILEVRIGRWRVLEAQGNRRLAEVRELGCRRVAVRIERFADGGVAPSSEIWQLYDLDGRLEAALQTTREGKFALLTNYRTREACRLTADGAGQLRPVETWKI